MIENDINQPIQAAHLEAGMLLAEAVEKATKLGYTISVSGNFRVHMWVGKPLTSDMLIDSLFEADYITNLIDWLDGVSFGRSNII